MLASAVLPQRPDLPAKFKDHQQASVHLRVLIYVGANTLAMKEIEKHRKALIGLYLGACIGAGAFTLLPSRYLGGIVWSYLGLIG